MRIILIRHGESEGNVDPAKYAEKGDPNIELTPTGWRQAFAAGQYLRDWLRTRPDRPARWPHIVTSPFKRPQQTTAALLAGMGDAFAGTPDLREDVRLVEQSFGYLAYAKAEKNFLKRAFARTLMALSEAVYKHSDFLAPTLFGEAPATSYMRVDAFADMLEAKIRDGELEDDVVVVCHGATMRHFLVRWFDLPALTAFRAIKNPGNADILVLEDKGQGWQVEKIFDGEKGVACSENPIAGIARLNPETLPKLPDFLKPR